MSRRHLLAAALVLAVAVTSAAPAGASSATFGDPRDTATPLDIRTVAHADDDATVTWTVTTWAAFADREVTSCVWLLDTDGDGSFDRSVAVEWVAAAGRVLGEVDDANGARIGPAAVSRPDGVTLRVVARRSDLGNPSAYDYFVTCSSDVNHDGRIENNETDFAPDGSGLYHHTVTANGAIDPVSRLDGADRVATSVAASQASFAPGRALAAVLARSDAFADALAGAPLAAGRKGPLLLTGASSLDGRAEAELRRVLPAGAPVYLLGGPAALSAAVEQRVAADGFTPVRLAGADRYQTAVAVADRGLNNPGTLLLATGLDFPDALTAGSAAGKLGGAVLLTAGTTMPPSVRDYLATHTGATQYAIGADAATADPHAAEALVGLDRWDTSRRVADRFYTAPSTVCVASGLGFADALAGGARCGLLGVPLLLTDPFSLPPVVHDWLAGTASSIGSATVYGGTAVVDDAALVAVLEAIN
jgi:putative cell wall-binding protein